MRKYVIFSLLAIILISCNKPIPFHKDEWAKCGGFDGRNFIGDDFFIDGNTRYKMALWLEKNYSFCDKSLDDILDFFFIIPKKFEIHDSICYENLLKDKVLKITIRQHNPNFILGIDPPIDTDWFKIHFDENYMVQNVYLVHYNYKKLEETKRIICDKK